MIVGIAVRSFEHMQRSGKRHWCLRSDDLTPTPASPSVVDAPGGFMNILAALRKTEARLQKQADRARKQLDAVRGAMKALDREVASSGKLARRKGKSLPLRERGLGRQRRSRGQG